LTRKLILVLILETLVWAEFILGKHLGLSGVLAVMLGVMLVIYLLMLLG
jgi:hypothetical protein